MEINPFMLFYEITEGNSIYIGTYQMKATLLLDDTIHNVC